jgi:hypothetical protein
MLLIMIRSAAVVMDCCLIIIALYIYLIHRLYIVTKEISDFAYSGQELIIGKILQGFFDRFDSIALATIIAR